MRIRTAKANDIDTVVRITKANNHFWSNEVDGPEALARMLKRPDNLFLVCEFEGDIAGFVLGTWDGVRAFIHKMSVRSDMQGRGVGRMLADEAARRFGKLGAPTVGVNAADGSEQGENDSTGFWRRVGFEPIPARLMIRFDIRGEEHEG